MYSKALTIAPSAKAVAAEFKSGAITVEQPWSRATPGGAKVASGYLTIENSGDSPDRLVSVTADIAGRTEIHQMSMTDGVVQMRQLRDGLPVPAHRAGEGRQPSLKAVVNHALT